MKVSNLFGITLRDAPADAEVVSHQLLMRAGYIRPLAAGLYSYLAPAHRSLRKIEAILREEMDAIGGQEINLPIVHPAEVWRASGRWDQIGSEMVRFKDRREVDMCLAMTHEEVVAWLARTELGSYRQLPLLVYQIQTKFRDEPRARGGLIRTREFVMKDSYSLDLDQEGLERQYWAHHRAYHRIFRRCGLPAISVASDPGMMGGRVAHEFMFVSPIGEDRLVICSQCDYSANLEVAEIGPEPEVVLESEPTLETIDTPGVTRIDELTQSLGVEGREVAKTVVYIDPAAERLSRFIMAVVLGDSDVNEIVLRRVVGAKDLRPAQDQELTAAGLCPGFMSPVGLPADAGVEIIVDPRVTKAPALVMGANEVDKHLRGARFGRDFEAARVEPIALAFEGAPCSVCNAPLQLTRGVEVGNIFQLGTRYTDALEVTCLDQQGRARPVIMGSYGIGVGRLLACVAEAFADEQGLALPVSIAPWQVCLVGITRSAESTAIAEQLYADLQAAGVEVLFDDRPKIGPGVKFAEAELRGCPLRVVVSDRGLKSGAVELRRRRASWTRADAATETEPRTVPLADAVREIQAEVAALFTELAESAAAVSS